jgi:hypothetical protein
VSGWAASISVANIAANVIDACTALIEACQRSHDTADVSRGATVHRRTAAQASMGDSALAHAHMSNHKGIRMECSLTAAVLQTDAVVWGTDTTAIIQIYEFITYIGPMT